jgi:hypothetical protein
MTGRRKNCTLQGKVAVLRRRLVEKVKVFWAFFAIRAGLVSGRRQPGSGVVRTPNASAC